MRQTPRVYHDSSLALGRPAVSVRICMRALLHIQTHTHTQTHTRARTHKHTHTHTRVHTHTHTQTISPLSCSACMCAPRPTGARGSRPRAAHRQPPIRSHVRTYVRTYARTHARTHRLTSIYTLAIYYRRPTSASPALGATSEHLYNGTSAALHTNGEHKPLFDNKHLSPTHVDRIACCCCCSCRDCRCCCNAVGCPPPLGFSSPCVYSVSISKGIYREERNGCS